MTTYTLHTPRYYWTTTSREAAKVNIRRAADACSRVHVVICRGPCRYGSRRTVIFNREGSNNA